MEKIRRNRRLEWLIAVAIILSCLPCHLGYAQGGKPDFEEAFRQLQIKQAMDKAEKDMRRRGKLMMDLEKYGYIQSCVSCNRRTYISCKLSQEELEQRAAEEIVNASSSLQIKRYHEVKRASRIRINEILKFAINSH